MKTELPPLYHWIGKSGKTYPYMVFEFGALLWNQPGNYILCDQVTPLQVMPREIGQTDDLADELMRREMNMRECETSVPAYVHVRINLNEADSLAEENDLKELYLA
jgi:cation transport regulator ChaC